MRSLICCLLMAISITLVTSINFECEYHYFRLGPIIGDRYSCRGFPRGDISDPIVRGITGVHQPGHDNSDVIGFYMYDDTLVHLIPRGLPQFFPNMVSLAMLNCTLIRLHSDDLAGYGNLRAFSLRQNYIEEIPQYFYEYVPNLESMNMLENRIVRVAPNILAPLHRLTSANFSGNRCVDFAADISTLSVLQQILNTDCSFGSN